MTSPNEARTAPIVDRNPTYCSCSVVQNPGGRARPVELDGIVHRFDGGPCFDLRSDAAYATATKMFATVVDEMADPLDTLAEIDTLKDRGLWPDPMRVENMVAWGPSEAEDDALTRTLFEVILNSDRNRRWADDKTRELSKELRETRDRYYKLAGALDYLRQCMWVEGGGPDGPNKVKIQMIDWVVEGNAPTGG